MKNSIEIIAEDGKRVVHGTGCYQTRSINDLREMVIDSAERYGEAYAFKFKDGKGNITGKTYRQFKLEIDYLGTALMSIGLKDTYISIISENRYEWGLSYLSIINGTGVAVPMDKYLPQNEVENLVERGKVQAVFYSPSYYDMMKEIAKTNKKIKYFICFEKINKIIDDNRFLYLADILEKGKTLIEGGERSFIDAELDNKKMSILLFTSGTTSISKGVMLSHENITSNIIGISSVIKADPGDVHLSLLPLHHTFENTIGLMFMVYRGVCIAYSDGIKHVAKNLAEYNVTILVAVPAILEAMYNRMQDGIKKSGKGKMFGFLVKMSNMLRTIGIDIRKRLFRNVLDKIGPYLRIIVSGAAPLDPEVIDGFDNIGLKIIQGYGLTETSPVIAANNDFANKKGTVGFPLKGIDIVIDCPDENGMGEIVSRGRNVMIGYYENPEATKEAIDGKGWFRTGDLGIIDNDGFLKVTGRAKSMIVFTNGKKAFPEEYEALLNSIAGVKDSFAWGNKAADGDIQVCAEIIADMKGIKDEKGEFYSEEEFSEYMNAEIKKINKNLPQYKIIRYFILSGNDIIKTTTLKIKRPAEYEKIKAALTKAGVDMRKASGKYLENIW